jgi:DNA-binding NarL/FixJ family response regulator
MGMPKTTVLLADDHTIVAQGIETLLKDSFDLVGVVHDGRALLQAAEMLHPDVIVTDISMPLLNGIDAIRQLRSVQPDSRIVVLTMHTETWLAEDAFRAGASGYLLKISPVEELIEAIRQVAHGRAYVSAMLAKDLISLLIRAQHAPTSDASSLTRRQREVLQLVAEGRTMKEVGSLLRISARTVEAHKYQIMHVLGAQTTAELIQYAIRIKLIPG